MHIVLFAMLALTGADAGHTDGVSSSDHYYSGSTEVVADGGSCACQSASCQSASCDASCGARAAERRAAKHAAKAAQRQRKHMMPQTCYQPRYGCYYSGDRYMNRYPAFHGTYYRRPYNYRNLFEYPWHAGLHEPTSMFSYNVEEDSSPARVIDAEDDSAPPVPPITVAKRVFVGD